MTRLKPSRTTSRLRVVAGLLRHRLFEAVPHEGTRETKDAVKEAIFNRLQPELHGASVLDAFAGSGALSIEAYSRGAKTVVSIEKDRTAFDICKRNFDTLGVKATLHHIDIEAFLKRPSEGFDIILLDPPYHQHMVEFTLNALMEHHHVLEHSLIVVLHEHDFTCPNTYVTVQEKRYGRTRVTYLERKSNT